MPEPFARKKVTVIREGTRRVSDDTVVVEAPLEIYLNRQKLVTLLCTPEKRESLALGFCARLIRTSTRRGSAWPEGGAVEIELRRTRKWNTAVSAITRWHRGVRPRRRGTVARTADGLPSMLPSSAR